MLRHWDHQQDESDTEDTDPGRTTQGIKYFSHGSFSLTHQHWIRQLISAGSFDVHDTQGAESSHKLSVHLSTARVRHLQGNKTQEYMLNFLCNHLIFDHIEVQGEPPRTPPRRVRAQINVPLRTYIHGVGRGPDVTMGRDLNEVDTQSRILHCEARVARVELMDLVCAKFGMPKTRRSYEALGKHLEWTFGQRMVTVSGHTYYATDSQYLRFGGTARTKRRAKLRMAGRERVACRMLNGNLDTLPTALCCQVVCFFSISGISNFVGECNVDVPDHLLDDLKDDSMSLMLVRWFSPHPTAFERDELCRPICPGPFRENHCLWQFAKTTHYRLSICNADGTPNQNFRNQEHMFGDTNHKRMQCFEDEKQAYYDVLSPLAIQGRVHMTREYIEATMTRSQTWIETVTLI